MPVETPSRDYIAQAENWALIRSLSEGANAVRKHVLPLPGMAAPRATEYQKRAYYLPALPRTVEMFNGLVFLRDPLVKAPDALKTFLDDVDMGGTSFANLASQVVAQQIEVSRVAVLVDHPPAPIGITKAEAERLGLRAHARIYNTESILAADYRSVGGVNKLWRVRLQETEIASDDKFEEKKIERVRVLELIGGVYTQCVHTKDENGKYVPGEIVTPLRNGKALEYLPIFFFNHRDHSATAMRPPLADLADVSVSHLNSSALREWGEMWTANPTPWGSGFAAPPVDEHGVSETKATVNLGSSEMLVLNEGGELGFLEFAGTGLKAIAETMDRKEKHMAALGTRVLLDDPRGAIAAETANIQRAGENSTLGKITSIGSSGLTYVLRELALWAGITKTDDISVTLNKNFVPAGMAPEKLKALLAAVQAGEMSSLEFFEVLKASDVISQEKDWEAHRAELDEDGARIAERDAWLLDSETTPVEPKAA